MGYNSWPHWVSTLLSQKQETVSSPINQKQATVGTETGHICVIYLFFLSLQTLYTRCFFSLLVLLFSSSSYYNYHNYFLHHSVKTLQTADQQFRKYSNHPQPPTPHTTKQSPIFPFLFMCRCSQLKCVYYSVCVYLSTFSHVFNLVSCNNSEINNLFRLFYIQIYVKKKKKSRINVNK